MIRTMMELVTILTMMLLDFNDVEEENGHDEDEMRHQFLASTFSFSFPGRSR